LEEFKAIMDLVSLRLKRLSWTTHEAPLSIDMRTTLSVSALDEVGGEKPVIKTVSRAYVGELRQREITARQIRRGNRIACFTWESGTGVTRDVVSLRSFPANPEPHINTKQ
jgi:hypothetical protein